MFCQKCGSVLAETATACPSCSTPVAAATAARAGGSSAALAETLKASTRDAFAALRRFAGNPVGGLQPACASLGPAGALRTGLVFGLISLACFLLGGYLLLPPYFREDLLEFLGFGGVVKGLLFAAVPFLGTAAGGLALRRVFGGRGTLGSDCFTAGAALLPASAAMLLSGFLGHESFELIGVLAVFAGSIWILMLFAGLTRISQLSERVGAFGVPAAVLLTVWLAQVLAGSILDGPDPAGFAGDFPY